MFVMRQTNYAKWALFFLVLVLASNFILYRSPLSSMIIPEEASLLVLGSLLDFAVVAPLLLLATFRLTAKQFIGFVAGGFILARLLVPSLYFEPFAVFFYVGIGLEALVLFAEIALLGLLIIHIPKIHRSMKNQTGSPLFTLFPAVFEKIKPNPLIAIILSEALAFYYALFSWKKKAPEGPATVSLHKDTSVIAMNIMLIHAVVIETIGLHWWFHEESPQLSLILLILNIYTVVYFLGEIQAIRLNPLTIKDGNLNVSIGLSKRISVPLEAIESVRWGDKVDKEVLAFMAKDFEEPVPQVVIDFKTPQQATLFYGRTKSVSQIALKVDDPDKLRLLLESKVAAT